MICFLFSGEKFPTLTSHREGSFFTLHFKISQNNHISLYFASYDLGFSPICPRRPGEGWEPSGCGFAPLHRPFGRPAFFMAGPRVTEVSLSGSTRRLSYSVFKVLCWSLVKAYQKFFHCGSDWEYTLGGLAGHLNLIGYCITLAVTTVYSIIIHSNRN